MKYYFPLIIMIATCLLIFACKGSKKATSTKQANATPAKTETASTTTPKTETRTLEDIPSFLARMVRDTRKADNTQSLKIDMFTKEGQQYYGFNNCNGCSDAMTVVYDASGKKIANCGGFAGFRGEYCEALAKAKTMYQTQKGKIVVDEWKLEE